MTVKCPICKKEVALDATEFPFCSDRCRIIDLANWASEKYRVAAETTSEGQDEEQE